MNKYIYILGIHFLSACDIADCVIPNNPELSLGLPVAFLQEEYKAEIVASVSNDSRDDNYDYRFSVKGELPNGLLGITHDRKIVISGMPQELGTFDFSVNVRVEEQYKAYDDDSDDDDFFNIFEDDDGLCKTSKSRTYSIIVKERKT